MEEQEKKKIIDNPQSKYKSLVQEQAKQEKQNSEEARKAFGERMEKRFPHPYKIIPFEEE